jgi:hypothetical protein
MRADYTPAARADRLTMFNPATIDPVDEESLQ